MSGLRELIGKLEKAEGGSGGLDGLVWEATGHCAHRETKYYAVQSDTGFECTACGIDMYGVTIPKVTTDLNAALALVEEMLGSGFLFHMGRIGPNQADDSESGHEFYFCLPEAEHVSSPNDIDATGHTLPLAVCIALLKAEEKK